MKSLETNRTQFYNLKASNIDWYVTRLASTQRNIVVRHMSFETLKRQMLINIIFYLVPIIYMCFARISITGTNYIDKKKKTRKFRVK